MMTTTTAWILFLKQKMPFCVLNHFLLPIYIVYTMYLKQTIILSNSGKLRSLIPYQPQYKRPELDDEEANNSQCLHCDTQIRQVKIF